MPVDNEEYENGSAKMLVYHEQNGDLIYIQSGIVGMYMRWEDMADLYELLDAYIKENANG